MSVVAAVVATDSMSRMAMDMIPQEVKASYVEPMVDYAYDFVSSCVYEAEQVIGAAKDYFGY